MNRSNNFNTTETWRNDFQKSVKALGVKTQVDYKHFVKKWHHCYPTIDRAMLPEETVSRRSKGASTVTHDPKKESEPSRLFRERTWIKTNRSLNMRANGHTLRDTSAKPNSAS
jgi:hypothetical protein